MLVPRGCTGPRHVDNLELKGAALFSGVRKHFKEGFRVNYIARHVEKIPNNARAALMLSPGTLVAACLKVLPPQGGFPGRVSVSTLQCSTYEPLFWYVPKNISEIFARINCQN